ncbi:MAG: DUF3445 domain-containing protein [Microthrixaceae bacterium]|nr:DUF3445 domain-containing protein [Microthrixaceae bacterium]
MSRGDAPSWLDELVLEPGPPWHHMGLRAVDEAAWLVVDDRREAELAEKARLLAQRHDEVFAALDGTGPAGDETLALITGWLARHRPDLVIPRPAPGAADAHPLEVAGRQVQEDLCLMDRRDGATRLVAASLCFPTHWRLRDKIGGSAAAIHGPVPHYREELAPRVDRFLERIPAGRISVRRNWGVHDHDTLFVPEHPSPRPGITADDAGERLWLRSERQTLRRLPETGAVLFTIRVQFARLGVLAARPDVARRLAAAARGAAAAGTDRVPAHLDAVCAWLDRVR